MFFLSDSLSANKGGWMWQKKNNQKIQKCNFTDFTRDFLIIFYRIDFTRMYSSMKKEEKHVANG